MNKFGLVMAAFLCVAVVRTAGQGGATDFARDANFSQYKSYKWVHLKSPQELDDLTVEQLIGTLEVGLEKKNLTKSKSETADLYIGYEITDAKDTHWNPIAIGSPYDPAVDGAPGNGATPAKAVHTGVLTLMMFDSASKRLVWRSTTTNAIDADAKPDKKQKHMDSAVEKLLKDYPPRKT
jgi:Domain of unknown function (DUF4136)